MLLSVGIGIGISTSACREYEMNSQWKARNIVVDGSASDWSGLLGYIEDKNVSIGIVNDGRFLYICLTSGDRSRRLQVMSQGMTLWFDPNGKHEKAFGIRFPLGRGNAAAGRKRPPAGTSGKNREALRSGTQGAGAARKKLAGDLKRLFSKLEILGPGKNDVRKISLTDIRGIRVGIDRQSDMLTYELKIPLALSETLPNAIGTLPGKTIGLGIEIPKMERSELSSSRGRRMPGGGMGGMGGRGGRGGGMRGGGMRGGGGRMAGGMRPDMFGSLKIWITVHLASQAHR